MPCSFQLNWWSTTQITLNYIDTNYPFLKKFLLIKALQMCVYPPIVSSSSLSCPLPHPLLSVLLMLTYLQDFQVKCHTTATSSALSREMWSMQWESRPFGATTVVMRMRWHPHENMQLISLHLHQPSSLTGSQRLYLC